MKTAEYDDTIFYKSSCACNDDECMLNLVLEKDKDFDFVTLLMYQTLKYASYWGTDNWFSDKWKRITGALKLLFTGELSVENSFLFESDKHIDEFINALQESRKKLKTKK